jgi:DNA-binding transcriptional ArsR family regulator
VERRTGVVGLRVDQLEPKRRPPAVEEREPVPEGHGLQDEAVFVDEPEAGERLELLGGGPATISELAEPFGLTLNGVKKHVSVLEDAELVTSSTGTSTCSR